MRAIISDRNLRQAPYRYVTCPENALRAVTEARRILGETEPQIVTQGVTNRHFDLGYLGWAGRTLAEALAAFVADCPYLDA